MTVAERDAEKLEQEISPSVQQELLQHPGKWAAITRTEVIAVGDKPGPVVAEARARGIVDLILYRVPDAATLYFY